VCEVALTRESTTNMRMGARKALVHDPGLTRIESGIRASSLTKHESGERGTHTDRVNPNLNTMIDPGRDGTATKEHLSHPIEQVAEDIGDNRVVQGLLVLEVIE